MYAFLKKAVTIYISHKTTRATAQLRATVLPAPVSMRTVRPHLQMKGPVTMAQLSTDLKAGSRYDFECQSTSTFLCLKRKGKYIQLEFM